MSGDIIGLEERVGYFVVRVEWGRSRDFGGENVVVLSWGFGV